MSARSSEIFGVIVFFALACVNSAGADTPQQLAAGADFIVQSLATPQESPALVKQIVASLRTKQGICKTGLLRSDDEVALCLRGNEQTGYRGKLAIYVDYAVSHHKLDSVEAAVLNRLWTSIISVQGDSPDSINVSNEPLMPLPGGHGVAQPSLFVYRQNKAAFAALRKAKGAFETLPADLLKQMQVSFQRTMNGVGKIDAEQYFSAQLDRIELNELAGLMVSATDFLARPDARVTLYPGNYFAQNKQLENIQSQEVTLAEQILAQDDLSQRTQLEVQLKALESQGDLLSQKDIVDQLTSSREQKKQQLQGEVLAISNTDIASTDTRAQKAKEVQALEGEISDVDQQLAKLIRTELIPPEDIQRLAFNSLKSDFQTLLQENPYNQLSLQPADALLAAWISGDVSSDALRVLSQFPSLKEKHEGVWKRALGVTWDIGKSSLMALPTTSYIAIALSIFLEIRDSAKIQREGQADATHLIPQQP